MDVNSPENARLLRNCMAIEYHRLKGRSDCETPEIKSKIQNYLRLYQILTAENAEILLQTQTDNLADFSHYMLSTPPKDILKKYTDLTKQSMIDSNCYDKAKFQTFKNNFYADFEKDSEKAPEAKHSQYCTSNMKTDLQTLDYLFQANKASFMSLEQLRDFSGQFRDAVKNLGQHKFQQHYDTVGKKIMDMQISSEQQKKSQATYIVDLSLLDGQNQLSKETFQDTAPAFQSFATDFQNLCYAYLEGDKFANLPLEENPSTNDYSSVIKEQMKIFQECYQKLEKTAHLKLNISPQGKVIFSAETSYESERETDIACDAPTIEDDSILSLG